MGIEMADTGRRMPAVDAEAGTGDGPTVEGSEPHHVLGLLSPVDKIFDGQWIVRPDRVPHADVAVELVLADLLDLDHRRSLARRRARSRLEARFHGRER